MRWFKSKPVEPVTVEQIRAEKPDLPEDVAQAAADFTEAMAARRAAYKALPLRTRVGLWWRHDAYAPLRLVFKGSLLVIGWFTVWDWIGGGQSVLDYALRIGWILVGLVGLGQAIDRASDE
jgi:hypothetical protein